MKNKNNLYKSLGICIVNYKKVLHEIDNYIIAKSASNVRLPVCSKFETSIGIPCKLMYYDISEEIRAHLLLK
jgi:hypothetical protein